ncbi:hypothetical protein FSP39_013696 [Pinctada imbricata]|uniref:Phorbol-ester/DAG-type domain-containing protein n=1 Tax=Pinctada imbricata TaxID=66713 RepID=A0AA88YCJ4_PINIB|nr:hypothetical protein FSP39_013696 [Pinctada imbricata]
MESEATAAKVTSADNLPKGKWDTDSLQSKGGTNNIIHRVETETASIKFTGNIITDLADSENELSSSSEVDYMIKDIDFNKTVEPVTEWNDDLEIIAEKQSQSIAVKESRARYNSFEEQGILPPVGSKEKDGSWREGKRPSKLSLSFKENRFNPFDRDLHMEEDHFQNENNSDDSYRNKSSSNGSGSWANISADTEDVTNADLGLAEDHFSHPEGAFGLTNEEELEMVIDSCKAMIAEAPPNSDRVKNLVQKLIQLRLKLQELKEGPPPVPGDVKPVVGHRFVIQKSRSSKYYCEKCNAMILGVIQTWYRCNECGYSCHEKCLNNITRTCASQKVLENPTFCLLICPNRGLSAQNYRCAECRTQISFKPGFSEPRLCDYSGMYFCDLCHWNDTMIIPARVLHNWDFEPRKVCRASKQFLKLMTTKAVCRIQDVNPMLFNFVEELSEVKKLREELLIMKKYLLVCAEAMEKKFLLLLQSRQHFVDTSDVYSMQDLMDIVTDSLLGELAQIHAQWAQHIKTDCQLCQAKGFMCELCDNKETLFPFDNIAVVCSQCTYVLHRHCYAKKGAQCPRCERRSKRKAN